LVSARRAADHLLSTSTDGGHRLSHDDLLHSSSRAQGAQPAFSSDYLEFAQGLVCLYESCGAEECLVEGLHLAEVAATKASNDQSTALRLAPTIDPLPWVTSLDAADSPSGNENATAVSLFRRLAVHLNRHDLKKRAEGIALAFGAPIRRNPRAYCALLSGVDALLDPDHALIIRSLGADRQSRLRNAFVHPYAPNRVLAHFQDRQSKSASALAGLATA